MRSRCPKCFKSRKLVTLDVLSKYISLRLRKGEREGWKGGAASHCHQSIVNMNWIILQWRCFNMENENCSVFLWIDNMTIVHWEWMTAVAFWLSAQHKMNECYKFFQNGPLFHKSPPHPKINTRRLFTISANLASLYKPTCYRRPQSASVMSLLSGFAAAVKCQVKMPRKIYTAPQQKKGQEMVKRPCPDICELTSNCLLIRRSTASEFVSLHRLVPPQTEDRHLCASYTKSFP